MEEIGLQDLLLAVFQFNPDSLEHLNYLVLDSPFFGFHQPGQLHGNCTGPTDCFTTLDILVEGPEDSSQVYPVVLLKPLVFKMQDCYLQAFRYLPAIIGKNPLFLTI